MRGAVQMVLAWFDTRAVDALAERLIQGFVERVPLTQAGAAAAKKSRRAHDQVLRQAHEFARDNRLNVYKKARLANRFKWGLLEAGYPKPFVDEMAYELAVIVGSPALPKA